MRIVELMLMQVRIRLKRPVRHASFARNDSDTLLVRCRLDSGEVGWGEGLPRPYVTGESINAAWDLLNSSRLAPLCRQCSSLADVVLMLRQFSLPRVVETRDCYGNSARCAVEIAALDAFARALQCPMSEVFSQIPGTQSIVQPQLHVRYSGVISTVKPWKGCLQGVLYRSAGFEHCKVKAGSREQDDEMLLRAVRRGTGPAMDLRIDVNGAWNSEDALSRLEPLLKFRLSSVEQPIPHEQLGLLAQVRRQWTLPVVLDESVCSMTDAQRAINEGSADIFNLRLSKCGGLIPAVEMAALARSAGLEVQLGCQVGETGILSAAGRHFASNVTPLKYVEGSFDRFLVRDPLTKQDLTFGWRGWAPALTKPGLGVTIDEQAVKRVIVRQQRLV